MPITGIVEQEFVGLNYPNGGSWDKAIAWAEMFNLPEDPRDQREIGHFLFRQNVMLCHSIRRHGRVVFLPALCDSM